MPPNSTPVDKLPKELRANYKKSQKSSPVIEGLKIAAALKLWKDRDFRDINFEVPLNCSGKTVFVKVLAQNTDGLMFGVECASSLRLGRLQGRISLLQYCLPPNSYIIAVFPETAYERARRAVKLVDEVWVTGKNGKVNQMMFHAYLGKE